MTPERWRQVTEVFHTALAREAPARDQYLDDACAGDVALRVEVEAMLGAHAESGGVGVPALNMPATSGQQLEAGTMIGPYRIADLIDGQRFLVNRLLRDGRATPLRIVLNWGARR